MKERDSTIDIARGLAIFLMVQGNVTGANYRGPMTNAFEIYAELASFVPAMFVALAGAMVVYTNRLKSNTLRHFLERSAMLFLMALLIDVLVWRVVPFMGKDVLYLIAISLPVIYGYQRLGAPLRWLILAAVFAVTPFLQAWVGYPPRMVSISIFAVSPSMHIPAGDVLRQWFVSGWFPVFPWVGFAMFGANLGILRLGGDRNPFGNWRAALVGAAVIGTGVVLWRLYDGPLYDRLGYHERIYPPTLAYIVTSLGQIVLILSLVDWSNRFRIYDPLRACSESTLFIYIFHHVLFVIFPLIHTPSRLVVYGFASVAIVFAVAYALRAVRRGWTRRPFLLRYLLGV